MTKPLTILHVSSPFTWRGGEQQLMYLHKGLQNAGHQSIVFCPNESVLATKLEIEERALYNKRSGFDVIAAKKLAKVCSSHNIDVVHAHDAHAHTTAVLAATVFRNKTPIVLSRRVDFPIGGSWFSNYKYNHKQISAILCVSDVIRDMVKPKISAQHIEVATVHSGVDMDKFKGVTPVNLHDELDITPEQKLVANFSALADHKDYFTFIDTAKNVCASKEDVTFLIFGKGELEADLREYAIQSGCGDKILFAGFRNDLPQVYPNIDVLLFTSKTEGLGTTILDAFASNVPVVATRAGGIPEMIVHEDTGMMAEVGEADKLANYVNQVLDNTELRQKLVKNAHRKCLDFSKEHTVRQTENWYRKVLNN